MMDHHFLANAAISKSHIWQCMISIDTSIRAHLAHTTGFLVRAMLGWTRNDRAGCGDKLESACGFNMSEIIRSLLHMEQRREQL